MIKERSLVRNQPLICILLVVGENTINLSLSKCTLIVTLFVDSIENNIENAVTDISAGNQQLIAAREHQVSKFVIL